MKTLLQLNCTANWGSTGKIAEQIGLCAQEQGWDSYIAYGRESNPSKNKLIKVGSMLDVYEHYAENRLLDNEGLASRIPTKRLLTEIDKIHPDVVHLHNIHDHWLNYRILFEFLNTTNIPVVWTFHDCWAFTGHCAHFITANCKKWKNECKECPRNSSCVDMSNRNFNLKKSLFTSNKRLCVVPVSQWMGDFVKESFLKDKRIEVIHNGIDISIFKPQKRKDNCRFKILAVSSVWLPYKGINDIYKLRELLPQNKYDIIIVGLTFGQIENLPEGIIGIQCTQKVQDLAQLYSDADVLINPTYADTFPTVNLEALACGTPVITYRTGGSPEAVNENTGIVIEQGDIEAMRDAIVGISKNDMSDSCRNRAEEMFDKNKCYRAYISLYDKMLRGG